MSENTKQKLFAKTYSGDERRSVPVVEDGEVLVRPGTATADHDVRPAGQVVKSLREVAREETALATQIEQLTAELEARRAAAVEAQGRFDALVAQRDGLRAEIAKLTGQIGISKDRTATLEAGIAFNIANGRGTADECTELYRHDVALRVLPGVIAQRQSELSALEPQIADMAAQLDIPVPE